MSRTVGSVTAPVHYDRQMGEFLLLCKDCAALGERRLWPITLEFWNPNLGMSRCRACWKDRRNRMDRARFAADAELRERNREKSRQYRLDMRRVYYKARYAALKADPVKYEAHREREVARQRARRAAMREQQAA